MFKGIKALLVIGLGGALESILTYICMRQDIKDEVTKQLKGE